MPNPEQVVAAAKLGAEIIESTAPNVAAKLPGLIELCGIAAPKSTSLVVDAEARALLEGAAKITGNPFASVMLQAGEKSGIPMAVDPSRIAAVRESLLSGSPAAIDESLTRAFSPQTYAERRAFYGG
ncbi:MAG TPA: hypothetical protein V6C89_07035 [Drouetiella sp.]|jgi:hypothetical protein